MTAHQIRLGLTYDDVLLMPKKSPVRSRRDIDISSQLSRHIRLAVPIVSANMDTVTEAPMAIAVAKAGGIGIIHRFLTIPQQVREVAKVKRWSHAVIAEPLTLPLTATLRDVLEMRELHDVTSILIVDADRTLQGIVTSRDVALQTNLSTPVTTLMTPKAKLVTARPDVTQAEAQALLYDRRIEKLPLVDAQGKLKGLMTLSDIRKRQSFPLASKDEHGRLLVGAAIGVKDDYLERARAVLEAGADVLVLDIAHGHSDNALKTIAALRQAFPKVELIAGNVATAEGAQDLIAAGVDAIKVGVGPGSMCTTRVVTGAGVPQLTAVMDTVAIAKQHKIPVIADGGIRASGDVSKALAAGASTVMIGNMFAGTDESPGHVLTRGGRKIKLYRGMASRDASQSRMEKLSAEYDANVVQALVPEGVEAIVEYRGAVQETLHQLIGGLRSGMSYCGAMNLEQLHNNAEFIQITAAGWKESLPHDADVTS